MVATKRCAWGTSINDSSYPQRRIKNSNRDLVTLFSIPRAKKERRKANEVDCACRRGDNF